MTPRCKEGQAFGCRLAICLGAWQERQLPTLVSLTLARDEVPVMVALRLFLPKKWTSDLARLKRAGVPVEYQTARTKPEIALAESIA